MKPIAYRLENWSIVHKDPYQAPEIRKNYLFGDVYDHESFPQGHPISTTRIIGRKGYNIITKSGSCYALGDIDPEYEKQFPNARKRLFDSLEELT